MLQHIPRDETLKESALTVASRSSLRGMRLKQKLIFYLGFNLKFVVEEPGEECGPELLPDTVAAYSLKTL